MTDAEQPLPPNHKMVVAYDGTAYVGWERQKNGLGIQEVLEEALFQVAREEIVVEASGRTDAGVHAHAQVVSFRMAKAIPLRKLLLALNGLTPPDIAVRSIEVADDAFHARRSARSKLYRYTIENARVADPLERHRQYHFPQPLDARAMDAAARRFEGRHDFSALAREADRKKSCVRTILAARVRSEGTRLLVELHGEGFLYNMVRIITGTLIEVGLGRRSIESIDALLVTRERSAAGQTVPAHGLSLVRVEY